jgi:Tol biopolymer transport system component
MLNYSPKIYFFLSFVSLFCLSGCVGYPRVLNFPFDSNGRSLNSLASDLSPSIAGEYIAFVSDRKGSQDVYLYEAKNRRLIDLPGLNAFNEIASDPSVSEDGLKIVFASSSQGKTRIYLYNRETQQKRSLTDNIEGEVRNPTISADGSTVAFEVAEDGQWDLKQLIIDN